MRAHRKAKGTVVAAWALLLVIVAADVAWAEDIAPATSQAVTPPDPSSIRAAASTAAAGQPLALGAGSPEDIIRAALKQLKSSESICAKGGEGAGYPSLRRDYYDGTCPGFMAIVVEEVVKEVVVNQNTGFLPGCLRLHFHDCFPNGCDASLLLDFYKNSDGSRNDGVEKKSPKNDNLRGIVFDVVDIIKGRVEKSCRSRTVSCADILAATTWTALTLYMPPGSMLPLGFGRLDSKVSVQADAGGLPDSKEPADSVFEKFKSKRFSATDMWALLGVGHSLGRMACEYMNERVSIPTMVNPNKQYLLHNKDICKCKNNNGADVSRADIIRKPWSQLKPLTCVNEDEFVDADMTSPRKLDPSYTNMRTGKSNLITEVELMHYSKTAGAFKVANADFYCKVARGWQKLAELPPTGTELEVRSYCREPAPAP